MTSEQTSVWCRLLAVTAVSFLFACESVSVGPSLSQVTFSPAIDTPGGWRLAQKATITDPTVCCCHVTGNVTNHNSVPLHVTITFAAMDTHSLQLGRTVQFVPDLQPGATQSVEVSGFLLSCASIDHVNYQLNVSSVGSTPPL
jgi:hypothetical protein